jgi:hypothetical protein
MVFARLQRFPQRREQSFRIEENSPKALGIAVAM